MAKSLDALIKEADSIIERKAEASKVEASDNDIFKLANDLRMSGTESSTGLPSDDYTLIEKIAYARAIMDTVINLDYLEKVDQFEHMAKAGGISEDLIASYFEKNASLKFRSVMDLLRD